MEKELGRLGGLLHDIPDELKSRKMVIILLMFMAIALLTIVGTILVVAFGAPTTLFQQALGYCAAAGTGGAVAQAVPDTVQAKNGTYRAPTTTTATTTPAVVTPTVTPTPAPPITFTPPPAVMDFTQTAPPATVKRPPSLLR